MKIQLQTLTILLLITSLLPFIAHSEDIKRVTLRSEPATLSKSDIVQMIKDKDFSHPSNGSSEGYSGIVIGNFQHKYELKTLDSDDIIIDYATSLMWQQLGSGPLLWGKVEDYIKQLNSEQYAGFSDWRLPTIEELASLLKIPSAGGKAIDSIFEGKREWHWSADKVADANQIWIVDFNLGAVLAWDLSLPMSITGVRAVRSMPQE